MMMMKTKDTFYFPHDYNPLEDPKMAALVSSFGAAGYGLWWSIIEMLHREPEHKLPRKKYIYAAIAKQMATGVQHNSTNVQQPLVSVEFISTLVDFCVSDECELLDADESFFWSNRVFRNIEKRESISSQRSRAGHASAEKKKQLRSESVSESQQVFNERSTSVQQPLTDVQQNSTKERKGKEIKGNESKVNYSLHFVPNEFKEIFEKWLNHKKSKGQTYKSQESVEMCFRKLERLSGKNSGAAAEIINEAISNNYAGFFALNNNGKEKQSTTTSVGNNTNATKHTDLSKGYGTW